MNLALAEADSNTRDVAYNEKSNQSVVSIPFALRATVLRHLDVLEKNYETDHPSPTNFELSIRLRNN